MGWGEDRGSKNDVVREGSSNSHPRDGHIHRFSPGGGCGDPSGEWLVWWEPTQVTATTEDEAINNARATPPQVSQVERLA